MKSISRYVSLISVTSVLASGALMAQTSGTTSGSTGSSNATGTGTSNTRPYNSTTSGASSAGSDSSVSGSGSSSTSRSNSSGLSNPGNSSASGSLSGSTGTSGSSTMSGSAFSGTADPLVNSIHSGDFNSRAQLVNDIEQRLDTQKESVKVLKKDSKKLEGQARSDFKAAWDEVENHEKELKRSLREARNASSDRWETVRSELASHYQAYEAALARAQLQGTGGASVTYPSNGMSGSSSGSSGSSSSTSGRSGTSGSSSTDPSMPSSGTNSGTTRTP